MKSLFALAGGTNIMDRTYMRQSCPRGAEDAIMSQEAAVEEPVVVPEETTRKKPKPKRQPKYHVILWNDDHHTFEYVIRMMKTLFGHVREKGFQIALEVHAKGKAVCLTTTLEHAELKRDQIHAFGRDAEASDSKGSMWSTIEPES